MIENLTSSITGTNVSVGTISGLVIIVAYKTLNKFLDISKIWIQKKMDLKEEIDQKQDEQLSTKMSKAEVENMILKQHENCMVKFESKLDKLSTEMRNGFKGIYKAINSITQSKSRNGSNPSTLANSSR